MDNRTRIINTVLGKEIDRLPFFVHWDMNAWIPTRRRWEKEGVPDGEKWRKALEKQEGYEFDPGFLPLGTANGKKEGVNFGFCPFFEEVVIEDRGDKHVIIDRMGIKQLAKKNRDSIPMFLEYPVTNRADWERIKKERLDPDCPERFPEDWDGMAEEAGNSSYALQAGEYPYGLFGTLREFMGVEELLISFYTQPDLVMDMMGHITEMWISIYSKIIKKVRIDHIHMWEDMSGRQGSLISPEMVKKFMIPNYRKIRKFADKNGIPIFSVDTDGWIGELLPLFIEGGVNLVWPFEVAADSDITKLGRQHPDLCIMGGIDKRELAKSRDAIDRELERIAPMFERGKYIAGLDHGIPPDVSWENMKYYTRRLRGYILNSGGGFE